jgi:hypothetical protein
LPRRSWRSELERLGALEKRPKQVLSGKMDEVIETMERNVRLV